MIIKLLISIFLTLNLSSELRKGYILEKEGKLEDAKTVYMRLFTQNPDRVFPKLERVCLKINDLKTLEKAVWRVIETDPKNINFINMVLVISKWNPKEAIKMLKNSKSSYAMKKKSEIYKNMGNLREAEKLYKKLGLNLEIGMLYEKEYPEKAIKWLEISKSTDKQKIALIKCYIRTGNLKEALKNSDGLRDGKNFFRGEIAYFSGDFNSALNYYQKIPAKSIYSNDALNRTILLRKNPPKDYAKGEFLFVQGKYDEALKIFKDVIKKDSSIAPEALFLTSRLYEKKKDIGYAIEGYKEIENQYPETDLAPYACMKRGKIYEEKLKQSKDAISTYKSFLLKYPNSILVPEIRERLKELNTQ